MQMEFTREIFVGLPVTETMLLFTPRGEGALVPDWKPEYIHPESGEICEDMIFITRAGEEKTFWTCLAWQPEEGHVRYLRLTPASRVAFVEVRCRAEGDVLTRVSVSFKVQALTPHGRKHLAGMSHESFAASIDERSELI